MIQRGALLFFLILFSLTLYSQSWSAGLDLISVGKWFGSAREGVFMMVQKQSNARFSWRADLGLDFKANFREWDYFHATREVRLTNANYQERVFKTDLKVGPVYVFNKIESLFTFYIFPAFQFKYTKDIKEDILKYQLWPGVQQDDIFVIPFDEYDLTRANFGLSISPGLSIKLRKNLNMLFECDFTGSYYSGTRNYLDADWSIDWSNPDVSRPQINDLSYYEDKGFEVAYNLLSRIFIRYTF